MEETDIIGICVVCDQPVLDGDQHSDPEGLLDGVVHRECTRELDRPEAINPTMKEARGLF